MSVRELMYPLVSIGMPVRNGGVLLHRAIESVRSQDYPNLEIIVSDNASSDGSADLLRAWADHDPRVRLLTQERPLSAFDNFLRTLYASSGEFFMWAAHDDTRSRNYVMSLAETLKENPRGVLAFGRLKVEDSESTQPRDFVYDFETTGLSLAARLWKTSQNQCFDYYGLWRRAHLAGTSFNFTNWWPDLPVLMAAATRGEFVYSPDAVFVYREIPKSGAERAQYQDYRSDFSRVRGVRSLLSATWRTTKSGASFRVALSAVLLVAISQARKLPPFMANRAREALKGSN